MAHAGVEVKALKRTRVGGLRITGMSIGQATLTTECCPTLSPRLIQLPVSLAHGNILPCAYFAGGGAQAARGEARARQGAPEQHHRGLAAETR
eukprot:6443439-Pyramimonas_sp.AAC.1